MEVRMRFKALVLMMTICFASENIWAHDGLYIRFSLGTGYYAERSVLHESGFTTPAKNHALGWGFLDKFAVQISDFGGLIRNEVGDYNYINLDALGLGLVYNMPYHTYFTVSGGAGTVAFAEDWWEPTGQGKEKGMALNLTLGRE